MGDLVMWTGRPNEYSTLRRGVIYKCIEAKETPESHWSRRQYRFGIAFDIEDPVGTPMGQTGFMGSHEMKRLSLLDVATIRLHLDAFIRSWARSMESVDIDDVR